MTKSIRGFLRKPKHKVGICCIAKNEDRYLDEWVEHHLQIGVTRFYIYDNESTTRIATVLSGYIQKGIVKVEPFPGFKMQIKARKHCLANYGRNVNG
ncbi:glycosyltransferase family 2 protein [Flavitalea antarctica]